MAQFNLSITLEYDLIFHYDSDSFIEAVNKKLSEGWQPLGGAFTRKDTFCQTVVREEPKENHPLDFYDELKVINS